MLLVASKFGGLDNRHEPHLLGSEVAQDLSNVNLDSAGIRPLNGPGPVITSGAGTLRSIYKFAGVWIVDTIAWQYAEYGGNLYRAATGHTPQKSADGVTWYRLGIVEPPQPGPLVDAGVGNITGTVSYFQTYINAFGGESAPSDASNSLVVAAREVQVPVTASADPQVTGIRLYRQGDTTGTLKVGADLPNTTATITDNVAAVALGVALPSATWGVPGQLDGIVATPWGGLVGWIGKTLYANLPGSPDAWPATYSLPFNETIVTAVPLAGALPVLTTASPYLVLGSSPLQFRIQNITSSPHGCLGRDTAVDVDGALFWQAPIGICRLVGTQVEVVSRENLADAWASQAGLSPADPTTARAVRLNGRYLLFPQGGTSFPAGGYLEWDQQVAPPWKKGTVAANAVHYNRADNALYIAQGADVKLWEGGSAQTWLYQTGDWSTDGKRLVPQLLKSYRRGAVEHTGTVTADTYVDGTARGTQKSFTRASLGRSSWWLPKGCNGRRISVKLGGTGTVTAVLAEVAGKGVL